MNIMNIAFKEITTQFRHKTTFLFMIAFPIVLMLILGLALTNTFSATSKVGDMKVLYRNSSASTALNTDWNSFLAATANAGVRFVPVSQGQQGQAEVQADGYTAYVELDDNGLHLYGSSKDTMEGNIIQGMLTTFADRYNLAAAVMKSDPTAVGKLMDDAAAQSVLVKETSLIADKQPGSLDYYAVSMTTMIALYAALSATFLIRGERKRNTALRLMASPVSKAEIFAGKVIGSTFINLVCVVAVVLFSKWVFNANWGEHYIAVFLVLLTEVLLAISLGLGISYLFKGEGARSFVMIFTQIASFIGGAYFPIGQGSGWGEIITNLSPLRWANTALTQIIYADEVSAALPVIGINIGVAAAFLTLAVVLMRKREAL